MRINIPPAMTRLQLIEPWQFEMSEYSYRKSFFHVLMPNAPVIPRDAEHYYERYVVTLPPGTVIVLRKIYPSYVRTGHRSFGSVSMEVPAVEESNAFLPKKGRKSFYVNIEELNKASVAILPDLQ